MSLALASRTIRTVRLIDDDAGARAGYRYSVEDLHLNAQEVDGPIHSKSHLLRMFDGVEDAAICDLNLKARNYSPMNGDELVSALYSNNIPAILCTRWSVDLPDPVRHRRRQIPVVLSPNDLTSDSVREAFDVCIKEFAGNFSAPRRPWRALIRVEGGEATGTGHFRLNVVIPAWDAGIGLTFVVPLSGGDAIGEICSKVAAQDVVAVFGQVNLGAERPEDVYIDSWSLT